VSEARKSLEDLGVTAIGISPDSPAAQKKFDENQSLGFQLLSDPDHSVADEYGVWGEKNMYGKKSMGIIRSSFLIDEGGKIIHAFYKIKPEDTVPKALEVLGQK
jgi:thioredoxin-dependent peroxiredoxin